MEGNNADIIYLDFSKAFDVVFYIFVKMKKTERFFKNK